jgi:two-component system cell cycle sensor histidine kinase/response regulator CckA
VREFVRGGHEPVWERVESEPEMRAALEQREWDLVVSDYSLPRFSAPAALAVMKGMGLDLPFLVVSGVAGEATAVEMMRAGAHDFLLKGHFARLIPAAKRELEQAGQRRARRKAEEGIKRSEQNYRSLFESMLHGFAHCEMLFENGEPRDFVYLDVNKNFEVLTGLKDVVGRRVTEVIPGIRESSPELFQMYGRVALAGLPEKLETYVEALGIWFSISAYCPRKGHFVALFDNISERKRAEEAIRKSEERYRSLVEASRDGIVVIDSEGLLKYASPSAKSLAGYRPEDLLGGNAFSLVHPEDVPALKARLAELLGEVPSGVPVPISFRLRHSDGRWRFFEVVASKAVGSAGIGGFVLSLRDVTERKEREESIQKLLLAVEQTDDAIYMTDLNGTITYVNPGFEKVYGYSREEAQGKTPRILKSGQHDKAFYERFWKRLLAGGAVREQFVNRRRDGQVAVVEASVSSVVDVKGKRIGFIAVQSDITERRRSEEALRKSEKRFSLAFHASPLPTSIREIETNCYLDVNDQFVRVLGYPREELIGRTPAQVGLFVKSEDLKRIAEGTAREGVVELELQLRGRSGELHDVVGSATRIEVGSIPCVLATFLDVTEHKRAEEALRQSEERFRRSFSLSPVAMSLAEPKTGIILDANERLAQMLGYNREELIGRSVAQLDLWVDPSERREIAEAIDAGWPVREREVRLRTKSGEIRQVLDSIEPVQVGEKRAMLSVLQDITDRRFAEAEMRRSQERFRRLFESNTIGITVADLRGKIMESNDAYLDMIGYTREELLSGVVRWDEMTPAEDREKDQMAVEELQRTGIAQPYEKELIRKDGTRVPLLIGIAMLEASEGSIIAYTVDLSSRRQLEEQLRQAQKMEAVGQLAGGVAHDFNNLLTAILGYADILSSQVGEGSPATESVAEIRKAGERAASLTRQLLAFSRRQVLEPKVLDLNAVVENLEKMLRRLIGEDVELFTVLDRGIARVRADAGQLEQVVINLAVNARDAMPKGGTLTIETKDVELDEAYAREHISVRPGRYVMLAVSDTGIGMSVETKSHMFEPFFTTKGKGKGTGLGLATVYGIVKQSGGYIWAYSELDRGTSFKVYLPHVEGAVDAAPTRRKSERQTGGSETVLLVEDEQAVRALVRRILERYGYTVIEASGAAQALEAARRHEGPIHLILTDVIMPEMGGSELAPRLAELRPDVRVLFMSGYTDDGILRQGLIAEGGHFLQKPFTPEVLARKVRDVLDSEP